MTLSPASRLSSEQSDGLRRFGAQLARDRAMEVRERELVAPEREVRLRPGREAALNALDDGEILLVDRAQQQRQTVIPLAAGGRRVGRLGRVERDLNRALVRVDREDAP